MSDSSVIKENGENAIKKEISRSFSGTSKREGLTKITILLVDDDSGLLEVGRRFLEKDPQFSVHIAFSAQEAFEKMQGRDYEVIVSDYQMPGINGIEFLKQIRSSGNNIPFILFSGNDREMFVIQALSEGATFCLQKCSNPTLLFTDLSNAIRQSVRQKQMEMYIRDLERRETDLIDSLPDAIFAIDKNGVVTAWNHAMEQLTGICADEILEKGDYAYALPFYHERRPMLIDIVTCNDPKIIANYFPFLIRDGKKLISEITIPFFNNGNSASLWCISSPLYNREGKMVGAVELIRDSTERRNIEVELRESEEKYRALAENTADLLFSLDVNGIFTYVSPLVNRYGFLEEDVVSHPLIDFVYPDDRKGVLASLKKVTCGEPEETSVFRIVDMWGNTHWVEEKGTIRVDVFGKAVGLYGVLRDITDHRQAENAMQLANKKLNLLNSITRHDILNTVTGVIGCVDMAVSTKNKEEHDILLAQIKDLVRVIQRQITFTREYQEVGVNAPVWQNLKEVMERDMVNFSQSEITFVLDLEDTEIYADPLLEKVFYNLIDNALRYGETITTIRFFYVITEKGMTLICEDDGIGIPDEAKDRIFERGVGKNTGMGLFLSREILMITGITIQEIGTSGKGARFELLIPHNAWRFVKTGRKK
ncbi:PAS domain S-box protein [Methanoregula sp.]|jgi:PAS domain S-box-containing protein|uniref:PAS domain S-box protein n=1 Tax=Methanoregula sp. TaxID=2052170 RepID=UPI003C230C14